MSQMYYKFPEPVYGQFVRANDGFFYHNEKWFALRGKRPGPDGLLTALRELEIEVGKAIDHVRKLNQTRTMTTGFPKQAGRG